MDETAPAITVSFKEKGLTLAVDFADYRLTAVEDETGRLYARFLVTYRVKGSVEESALYVSAIYATENSFELP